MGCEDGKEDLPDKGLPPALVEEKKDETGSMEAEERQFVTYQDRQTQELRALSLGEDGSTYTGLIKDGKRHGAPSKGDAFRGLWNSGHGVWQSKNCQYEGQWKADAQDGQGRQTWSDGRVYEGPEHCRC